jgi:DNA-binding NarL/FixJ family response regulator
MAAIKHVLKGGIYVPQNLPDQNHSAVTNAAVPYLNFEQFIQDYELTGKQSEVIFLLIRGMSNKVIGRELDLAEPTVKSHVTAILNKLKVANRTQVVYKANQLGLVLPIKI